MAQLVDSKERMLSSTELLTIASENQQSDIPPRVVLAGIKTEMKQPGTLPLRYGNTIFIVHKGKNRAGFFRALNADIPKNYLENSLKFTKEIYDLGFDFLVTQYTDPSINSLFKGISRRPPREEMGFQTQKLSDGTYQSIFKAGPTRPGDDLEEKK